MATQFVPLGCTSCGAKADVDDEIDRFTCGYCGTEIRIEREDGWATANAPPEDLRGVTEGALRAAAELALVRYERELQELRAAEQARNSELDVRMGITVLVGAAFVCVGIVTLFASSALVMPLLLIVCGGFFARMGWRYSNPGWDQVPRAKLRELEAKIAEKRKIADS